MSLLRFFPRLNSFFDDVKRIREALERLSPPNFKDPRRQRFWT